jgi:hypothetical protein
MRRSLIVQVDGGVDIVVRRRGRVPRPPMHIDDGLDAAADDFDWNTPKRWACKAPCAFLHGSGCKEQCGFDVACMSECDRKLRECIADCDARYP